MTNSKNLGFLLIAGGIASIALKEKRTKKFDAEDIVEVASIGLGFMLLAKNPKKKDLK